MPPKSHQSEYAILAVLGLVTAAVLLWMAGSGLLREQREGRPNVRSTQSTNDDGLLICYTLFERLGLPVERSNRMLLASQLEGVGTVFLIDPLVPVGAAESGDLGLWVARGGILVTSEIIPEFSPMLRRLTKDHAAAGVHTSKRTAEPPEEQHIPVQEQPSLENDRESLTEVPEEADSLPTARDVSTALFETDTVFRPGRASPNAPATVMEPLFTDNQGVRIAQWRVGRGLVILLSDSSFLANANIAEGDNAVLATNLISYARARANRPRIVFDEFHFGVGTFSRGMGVLALKLLTTSAGWAILALTVAGLLFLFYKGRQFGPRRDLGRQRRRSKLEYVRAVGATYRAAGAHRLTLRLIYTWFRQQLANRTGLTTSVPNSLVARELARRGKSGAADYQRILDRCDRLLSQPQISQRQLTTAVAQLARMEKEVLYGSGDGKRLGR